MMPHADKIEDIVGDARQTPAYQPDYAVHPNEFLKEWLDEHLDWDDIFMSRIAEITGIPRRIWLCFWLGYEDDCARLGQSDCFTGAPVGLEGVTEEEITQFVDRL